MYKKKFETIDALFASEEFKKKDLSYCDLEGLDLSGINHSTWNNFIFDHTNFTDTNIKFYPKLLKKFFHEKLKKLSKLVRISRGDLTTYRYWKIEYCNFTNCDLSYLDTYDLVYTSVTGSNFTNTSLDTKFTQYYGNDNSLGEKDYTDVVFPNNNYTLENINKIMDILPWNTLQNNPLLPFSSEFLFSFMKRNFPLIDEVYLSSKKIKEFNLRIDELLLEDLKREGRLNDFYNLLNENNPFSEKERILFFLGKVMNKKYTDIDFSSLSIKLLNKVIFESCHFGRVKFPDRYETLGKSFTQIFKNCEIEKVYFPTIDYHYWNSEFYEKKLGKSRITFQRNLYLELGRDCNGKCIFCRNQYLDPCKYDFDSIEKGLIKYGDCLDTIIVGGGEPTMRSDDLLRIQFNVERYHNLNWKVFTNASLPLEKLIFLNLYFDLNISRHSVSDDINDKILGVHSLDTESLRKLSKENKNQLKGLTLCPTCFKGDGIDTVEKVEDYIECAYDLQIDNLLFQTLHRDLSINSKDVLPIEEEIFDEVIAKLREQNYEIVPTIYSTGDYKLIIAKNGRKTISFKKYITEEELKREWPYALKRTFDFSMDPSGNLYENFHQTSGKVIVKK